MGEISSDEEEYEYEYEDEEEGGEDSENLVKTHLIEFHACKKSTFHCFPKIDIRRRQHREASYVLPGGGRL